MPIAPDSNYNMNISTSNTPGGSNLVASKPQAFYDKVLLETIRVREFDHAKYAQQRPMPRNAGDTVNFRRINKLQVKTNPLTEGVTPDGDKGEILAITAKTEQYGSYMMFSDRVNFHLIDPIISEYTREQGYQAQETLDVVTRDTLHAGSNVRYAGGKTSRATLGASDKFSMKDIRAIVRDFKKNLVRPVNGVYIAIISADTWFDIMDDAEVQKVMQYGGNTAPLVKGELFNMYGVSFHQTNLAKSFFDVAEGAAAGVRVQSTLVFGANAYGITKINGEGDVKTIIKALGSAGTADPLDQRQTIGWKVNAFVAKILTPQALTRYEHVASI